MVNGFWTYCQGPNLVFRCAAWYAVRASSSSNCVLAIHGVRITCIHAFTQAYKCTGIQRYMHTNIGMHIYRHTNIGMPTYRHTCLYACKYICMHIFVCLYIGIHAYMHACRHICLSVNDLRASLPGQYDTYQLNLRACAFFGRHACLSDGKPSHQQG